MAKHETSWILELVDHITKPLRDATQATEATRDAVESVREALSGMSDESRDAAERSLKSHRELTENYEREQAEIRKLTKWLEELGDEVDPLTKAQIDFDIKQAQTKARRYKEQLIEVEQELKEIENGPDTEKLKANWGAAIVVANQTAELVDKAINSFSFVDGIEDLRVNIKRMTDLSGDALDEVTDKAYKLGKVYREAPNEIAQAANAMTKQIGGTYEENLALIEAGFQKGANINGDFLEQLREYPTFIRQLGITQAEAIALTAQAGKQGIFSDKAVDSLKEANLSLREMGQPQIDALRGIGLEVEDLAGKTTFEAVKMISGAMEGATDQAKQLVLADIFKGAGEDAGLAWIEGLNSVDLDINNIESVKESGGSIREWLGNMESWFSETFGSILSGVSELSGVTMFISSMIPIIQTLTASTKVQTAAQWALNLAMNANPIGLIIAGVTALIALIGTAIAYYDEWGATALAVFAPIVNVIMSFRRHWDSIVEAFENDGIVAGLKRIGLTLLDAILMPLQQALELISKLPGMGKVATAGAQWIADMRKRLELDENDPQREKKKEKKKQKEYDFATLGGGTDQLDGKNNLTGSGSGRGSGTGGTRTATPINMTLNVNNNFSVADARDFWNRKEEILDYIVGRLNDSLKDALITSGV